MTKRRFTVMTLTTTEIGRFGHRWLWVAIVCSCGSPRDPNTAIPVPTSHPPPPPSASEPGPTPTKEALEKNSHTGRLVRGYADAFRCSLDDDGSVWCSGQNYSGELGDDTRERSSKPRRIRGLPPVAALRLGSSHACAILRDRTVRCWGGNHSGELGDGTLKDQFRPVSPGLTRVVDIWLKSGHACALLDDGSMRCWGTNGAGELGDGTTRTRSTPVRPALGEGRVLQIAVGLNHTCALVDDRETPLRCWGGNYKGQLGHGERHGSPTPIAVPGCWVAVAASDNTTCARHSSGIACWGESLAVRPEKPWLKPVELSVAILPEDLRISEFLPDTDPPGRCGGGFHSAGPR